MALAYKHFFGVLLFLSVFLLIENGHAFEFKVGGSQGWTVPTDTNAPIYNQWAEKSRFQIGDTLLFVYPADQDSVLQVTKDDYTNCNTGSPIAKMTDGHTVYKLNQSGPHYFISGVVDHCHKNEKLIVVVMADRTHRSAPPSPPPSAEVPPSPAPSGEGSPSPPSPAPSEDSTPPEAPSNESSHPKNGASSMAMNVLLGSIAAFIGTMSLVLAY